MHFFFIFRLRTGKRSGFAEPALTVHQRRVRQWDRVMRWMTNAFFLGLLALVVLFFRRLASMVWPVL